jgi:sporulation protein YlmC with PRC-barrel domain
MKRAFILIGIMAACLVWFMQTPALAQVYPLRQMRAGGVISKNVFNDRGQFLGNVADVITGPDGNVRYLIISNGFGETPGTRLIPVPWGAANARVRDNRVLLDLPLQALSNAPYWRNGTTPYLTQQLEAEILNYFGIPFGEQEYYAPYYYGYGGSQYREPFQSYEPSAPYYYDEQPRGYQQEWNGGYYGEPEWIYPYNEEEEEEEENFPYGYSYFSGPEEQELHEHDQDLD